MSSSTNSPDISPEKHDDLHLYRTFHCCFSKQVLTEGIGLSKPLLESQCHFQHVPEVQEGSADNIKNGNESTAKNKIEAEVNRGKNVTIGLSEDSRSRSIESMLMTMKRGETSRFRVTWRPFTFTQDKEDRNAIQAQDLEEMHHPLETEECIVLALRDFSDTVPIWQLDPEQKYDLCLQHKNKGTSFFKEDKIESAFFQYSLALKYIISIMTAELDASTVQSFKQLRCICYLNLAACQINSENFESVVQNCSKGLALDAWNVKGLYRRALAYKNLGKLDEARSDLIKIVKKEPRNKAAADLLESLMPSDNGDDDGDTS